MAAVWETDIPAGEKLVLLALADCANDEGRCWPGVASLCRKTGKAERSLQGALKALESGGHITRDQIPGKGCRYVIHPTPSLFAPAKSAPRNKCAPQDNANTPAKSAGTPAKSAGKPSKKHQEPSNSTKARAVFQLPNDIPKQEWADFEEMRQRIRKPMTDGARRLAIKRLRKFQEQGHDPADVLNHCILNAYQGIFAPTKDRANGNGTSGIGKSAAAFAMLDPSNDEPF